MHTPYLQASTQMIMTHDGMQKREVKTKSWKLAEDVVIVKFILSEKLNHVFFSNVKEVQRGSDIGLGQ